MAGTAVTPLADYPRARAVMYGVFQDLLDSFPRNPADRPAIQPRW